MNHGRDSFVSQSEWSKVKELSEVSFGTDPRSLFRNKSGMFCYDVKFYDESFILPLFPINVKKYPYMDIHVVLVFLLNQKSLVYL